MSRLAFCSALCSCCLMGCGPSAPTAAPPAANGSAAGRQAVEETRRTPTPPPLKENIEAPPWPGDKSAAPQVLSAQLLEDGWISLFDGLSLFGWRVQGDQNWRVEQGAIVVDQGAQPALLCTAVRFRDYALHLEFQADPQTNSGVFLRTPPRPANPAGDCYELNIAPPDNPFPTGSLVGRAKVELDNAAELADGSSWRSFDVLVRGDQVEVSLDGRPILQYTDPQPLGAGLIGLQHNQGRVAFRNIRLKPLSLQPLFNGKDLAGWTAPAEQESRFSVTADGELHVQGGRGRLESEASFADFVLQLQCRTLAPKLNSGVFFRCIPGENMNGYESQIHNGYADNDRTAPDDFGTGAIFRRRKARIVAADDQQWFHKTIVADGDTFNIWVNGLLVTDWTDERPADANPRRGLRREAGTLMLQGHDPTTDLLFKDLRAASW